ncbi:MAG TPA: hypothetical protein ENH05_00145 [Rhizobiales bacterium]|nr:hypothetical protein BMS3Bbin10_01151 [bacterium BMS3Bbin10]HDO51131.1 hypothetical protein [Hyphomicrobiales bacterium]
MAQLTIVYWRDIPAQVIVKSDTGSAKRRLTDRFQEAIDMVAMRAGAQGTEEYLADWRRGDPEPCGGDCENEADRARARIETGYDAPRLKRLISGGGREDEE